MIDLTSAVKIINYMLALFTYVLFVTFCLIKLRWYFAVIIPIHKKRDWIWIYLIRTRSLLDSWYVYNGQFHKPFRLHGMAYKFMSYPPAANYRYIDTLFLWPLMRSPWYICICIWKNHWSDEFNVFLLNWLGSCVVNFMLMSMGISPIF